MSVNVFDRDKLGTADELEVIATKGRNRTYIGTQAAVESAIKRGDIGNESVVYITDDYRSKSIDPMPVGTILSYAGARAPQGYLMCDGSNYDTAKYDQLFAVLGRDKLPDLRSRFLMGAGDRPEDKAVDFIGEEQLPEASGIISAVSSAQIDQVFKGMVDEKRLAAKSVFHSDTYGATAYIRELTTRKTLNKNGNTDYKAWTTIDNTAYKEPVNGVPVKVRPDYYTVTYIIRAE